MEDVQYHRINNMIGLGLTYKQEGSRTNHDYWVVSELTAGISSYSVLLSIDAWDA